MTNQHVKRHLTLIRRIPEEDEALTKVTFDQDHASVPGSNLGADGSEMNQNRNMDIEPEIEIETGIHANPTHTIEAPIIMDEFVNPNEHDAPSTEENDNVPVDPVNSRLTDVSPEPAILPPQPVSMDRENHSDTENVPTNNRPQRARKMPAYLDNFLVNFLNLSNELNQFYPFKLKND